MAYLTDAQISEMAEAVLSSLEITLISRNDRMRVAREYALDEFGVLPSDSACGLAVKLATLAWGEIILNTKRELSA